MSSHNSTQILKCWQGHKRPRETILKIVHISEERWKVYVFGRRVDSGMIISAFNPILRQVILSLNWHEGTAVVESALKPKEDMA